MGVICQFHFQASYACWVSNLDPRMVQPIAESQYRPSYSSSLRWKNTKDKKTKTVYKVRQMEQLEHARREGKTPRILTH
jgi:hypothetical protein